MLGVDEADKFAEAFGLESLGDALGDELEPVLSSITQCAKGVAVSIHGARGLELIGGG